MKNIKIALILPAISLEERYNKAIAHVAGSLPPLGILSIATVLKKAGHSVAILDGTIQPSNAISEEINRYGPDIIGISAMTLMWPKVKFLSRELKKRWPGIDIIAGGVHASIIKEKALLEIPDIDAVCWGEGEFAMLEYAENFNKPSPRKAIDGIAFRGKDGSIIIGNDRKPINNLDLLPIPDRSLLPVTKYVGAIDQYQELPVTNMVTTRGCPFKCIFCLPDLLGSGTRYRSADKVIEEIEYLINEFGIRDITFWDDIFTLNQERVFDICQKIIEKRLDFIWSAQARADCVTPEMLELMARAGCWKLFYGVESLLQKNLDMLKKGETVKQIFDAVKWTKQAGIEAEGSFIFGIPGETFQDGLETIKLANKLNLDYARFYPLTPYGSLLENLNKYGDTLTNNQEAFTGNRVTFVPFSMTKAQLQNLLYTAYRRFYLRPKMAYKRIVKLRNLLEIRKAFNGIATLFMLIIDELRFKLKFNLSPMPENKKFAVICPICRNYSDGELEKVVSVYSKHSYNLYSCKKCQHLFTLNNPESQEWNKLYAASYNYKAHLIIAKEKKKRFYNTFQIFKKRIPLDTKIVDCGCMYGFALEVLRKMGYTNLVGIEINHAAVNECKRKKIDIFEGEFSQWSVQAVDEAQAGPRCILLSHVIEHLQDLDGFFRGLDTFSKSSCSLIIIVPNHLSKTAKLLGKYWGWWQAPAHLHHFSEASLSKLLNAHNFRVKQVLRRGADSLFWLSSLAAFLGIKSNSNNLSGLQKAVIQCCSYILKYWFFMGDEELIVLAERE